MDSLSIIELEGAQLYGGDCVEVMALLPENSIDAIVTDPPYGLEFMGKGWDSMGHGSSQQAWHFLWAEQAFRILKPGGHLLSFGGTRTYHRMASAVEDAGFEIRDMVQWLYGQGFPKSHNLKEDWEGWGTALKPAQEPIVLARKPLIGTVAKNVLEHGTGALNIDATRIHAEARPARVSERRDDLGTEYESNSYAGRMNDSLQPGSRAVGVTTEGRWPANVILTHHPECVEAGFRKVKSNNQNSNRAHGPDPDLFGKWDAKAGSGHGDEDGNETIEAWDCHEGCAIDILDTQTGTLTSGKAAEGGHKRKATAEADYRAGVYEGGADGSLYGHEDGGKVYGDKGGASRFFYVAKASKSERNAGLDDLDDKLLGQSNQAKAQIARGEGNDVAQEMGLNRIKVVKNNHPTVKPIALMEYLIRLVTPPGGKVLDPFLGSGTTGIAAINEGFQFVGIEMEPEYLEIAEARISHAIAEVSTA